MSRLISIEEFFADEEELIGLQTGRLVKNLEDALSKKKTPTAAAADGKVVIIAPFVHNIYQVFSVSHLAMLVLMLDETIAYIRSVANNDDAQTLQHARSRVAGISDAIAKQQPPLYDKITGLSYVMQNFIASFEPLARVLKKNPKFIDVFERENTQFTDAAKFASRLAAYQVPFDVTSPLSTAYASTVGTQLGTALRYVTRGFLFSMKKELIHAYAAFDTARGEIYLWYSSLQKKPEPVAANVPPPSQTLPEKQPEQKTTPPPPNIVYGKLPPTTTPSNLPPPPPPLKLNESLPIMVELNTDMKSMNKIVLY